MRTMPAGEFKAKCLAVMDEVQSSGQPLVVTKRGKPVVRLSPIDEGAQRESAAAIFGSLRHLGQINGDLVESELTDEVWEQIFNESWDRLGLEPSK